MNSSRIPTILAHGASTGTNTVLEEKAVIKDVSMRGTGLVSRAVR